MKTAIIIPTVLSNKKELKTCLDSINKYFEKGTYEILIELNDFEGFAVAVNRGLRKGLKNKEFDSFLTGNDDITIVEKGCLEEMKKVTEENIGVVTPPSLYRQTHIAMGWCYFPRRVIEDIGFFDERFKMLEWEDTDMSVRLQEKGYTLNKLKKEYMIHGGSIARSKFTPEQIKLVQNNKQVFLDKWKGTKWEKIFR